MSDGCDASSTTEEILYMGVSKNQEKIGVVLGRFLIKDKKEICQLAIYKRNRKGVFFLEKAIPWKFEEACIQFIFKSTKDDELLFFDKKRVFSFNYKTEKKQTIYQMNNELGDTPNFGIFNNDQSIFIVTSSKDLLYVDTRNGLEIDLDDREEVSNLQNIITDDEYFYVLANKKEKRLGYYLFKVNVYDPEEESEYLINWTNKLDIGDCDLFMLGASGQDNKSIVISYKSIGINTYNVFIIDLVDSYIKYWNESFHLWESPVKGFLLSTNDFMILAKDGMNLLALGYKESRVVKDKEGQKRMIHSLGSCNYLKIEPTNHLLFAF